MKVLLNKIKSFFKRKAIIEVRTGKYDGVVTVNNKRTFIPAHSTIHYGVGITSDKKTWPEA